MIFVNRDITQATEKLIIHGCNAQGKMNSGVARSIREKFPEAYEAYKNSKLVLGDVIYAQSKNKYIGNCITQENYGRDKKQYVSYDALKSCFADVNEFCKTNHLTKVAMPMIGAGLGGGDWDKIMEIMEEKIVDVTPIIYYV